MLYTNKAQGNPWAFFIRTRLTYLWLGNGDGVSITVTLIIMIAGGNIVTAAVIDIGDAEGDLLKAFLSDVCGETTLTSYIGDARRFTTDPATPGATHERTTDITYMHIIMHCDRDLGRPATLSTCCGAMRRQQPGGKPIARLGASLTTP